MVKRYKENYVTGNAPETFGEFREKGPGLHAPLIGADSPPLSLVLKDFRSFSTKHNPLFNGSFQNLSFLQERAHQRLSEQESLTNVILCMRTVVNTSFKESKLALAGCSENED